MLLTGTHQLTNSRLSSVQVSAVRSLSLIGQLSGSTYLFLMNSVMPKHIVQAHTGGGFAKLQAICMFPKSVEAQGMDDRPPQKKTSLAPSLSERRGEGRRKDMQLCISNKARGCLVHRTEPNKACRDAPPSCDTRESPSQEASEKPIYYSLADFLELPTRHHD
ncbi:hypothetical protein BV25DRAFT_176658 [Artomyces pyxidatus]|uniref:Uncharacterized protein n=1 Tax=Artomyces pyxidatus TaxID=48021 RepID=A0ACB8SGG7_9AGAM|nr:hypothetical protein BV25DRAFT_176658 [Artomyces pyxidatus]